MPYKILKKKKGIVSNLQIVEKNGQKMFVKKYRTFYSDQLVKTEFEKSKKIYEILKFEEVSVPKPVRYKLKTKEIFFEYIPNAIEIKKFFFKNSNILFTNKLIIINTLIKITKAIAKIHNELKTTNYQIIKFPGIDDKNLVQVWGDICNSNIILSKHKIYFLDFSPSYFLFPKLKNCFLKTHYYVDLAQLIISFQMLPLYQLPFYKWDNKYFEDVVIKTYLKNRKFIKFNKENLKKVKIEILKKPTDFNNNCLRKFIWEKIIKKKIYLLK